MKKDSPITLIIKIILLGIPLYLLMLYTWLAPMNFLPIEFSMWQQEKDYTISGPAADTLIVGDSRAKSGIIPALLTSDEDTVYNMAVGGATPIEMYYAMNRYLAHHETPKRVFLIFAPYHFCDIDNWNQTMTFNYLSPGEYLQVYSRALAVGDPVIAGKGSLTDGFSYRLRLPNKYMSSLYNASFIGRRAENEAKYASVEADLGYTQFGDADGDDNENYETHHEVFDSSSLVIEYYDRLLGLLQDNGIETIVLQSPVNQTSYDIITPAFWKGYTAFLKEMAAKYPEAEINMEVFPYPNRYFGDCNHLNRSGAEVFTGEVKEKYFR